MRRRTTARSAAGATSGTATPPRATATRCRSRIPATRPATHWDAQLQETLSAAAPKTWTLHVGDSFTDVPRTSLLQDDRDAPALRESRPAARRRRTARATPSRARRWRIFIARAIAGKRRRDSAERERSASTPYNCGPGRRLALHRRAADGHRLPAASTTSRRRTSRPAARRRRTARTTTSRGSRWRPSSPRRSSRRSGGPGVPLTYGPDPGHRLSYSCDTGCPNILLHRRARHRTPSASTSTFCGRRDHRRLRRRRSTVRTIPSPATRWRSSSWRPSTCSSTVPSGGDVRRHRPGHAPGRHFPQGTRGDS